VPANADLRLIVEAWPTLPGALRTGILTMVKVTQA
jgi:hypothetical protein